MTVDGRPSGSYTGWDDIESTTFVAGRAYVFTVDLGFGNEASEETHQLLRAFLGTVVIHAGAAVPLPSVTPGAR